MKAALFVVLVAVVGSLAACWTNEVRQREECVPVDSGAAACRTAADPSLFTELAGDCQSPLVSVDQGPVFVIQAFSIWVRRCQFLSVAT
jgi:hypothetical protein